MLHREKPRLDDPIPAEADIALFSHVFTGNYVRIFACITFDNVALSCDRTRPCQN